MTLRLRLLLTSVVLAAAPGWAGAVGLWQVWQAAEQHDPEHAVARATHAAVQPRRAQAAALWRPSVALTAAAGWGTAESDMRGASFSAPGLGDVSDARFRSSVHHGAGTRWGLQASQPLIDPQRRARQQQLGLDLDRADLAWHAARQALMLRTAERYLDLALAQASLALVDEQQAAVRRAADEVQTRFAVGDVPVTDTHEAQARLAALRAQRMAAATARDIQRRAMADSTGLPESTLVLPLPGDGALAEAGTLTHWQAAAAEGNLDIRQQALAVQAARTEAERLARAASPVLALVAHAGQDRLEGRGDARQRSLQAMVGVQLTMPLVEGGLRDAQEDEAWRRVTQAQAELDAVQARVARQVHAAWLGLSAGTERVQALQAAWRAAVARRDATRLGHEVGDRTLLDRLNAENEAAAAHWALLQARATRLLDGLRLAALAGRLDDAALREAAQALSEPPVGSL